MEISWKIFLNLKNFKTLGKSGRCFRRSLRDVENSIVYIYIPEKIRGIRGNHEISRLTEHVFLSNSSTTFKTK